MEETAPHLIPDDIAKYRAEMAVKREEQRLEMKRKLQDREEGSQSPEIEPKRLRRILKAIPPSLPQAFWPCRECLIPFKTPDNLTHHLMATHNYSFEESKN